MHSYEELKDTPEYQQWLTGDNEGNVTPGGESGLEMQRRVLEAFSELRANTCLVTHGGVIAAIMAASFPEEEKTATSGSPNPAVDTACGMEFMKRYEKTTCLESKGFLTGGFLCRENA